MHIYTDKYRRGGLYDLVQQAIGSRRGLAFGRNLFVPKTYEKHIRYTTLHETWHYYQMINSGWSNVLQSSLFTGDYNNPGNVEWGADIGAFLYGGGR